MQVAEQNLRGCGNNGGGCAPLDSGLDIQTDENKAVTQFENKDAAAREERLH